MKKVCNIFLMTCLALSVATNSEAYGRKNSKEQKIFAAAMESHEIIKYCENKKTANIEACKARVNDAMEGIKKKGISKGRCRSEARLWMSKIEEGVSIGTHNVLIYSCK